MLSKILFLRATQILLLAVMAVGIASEALAQSQAQINAIRQSCRNDYMAHCSSVTPGGPAALQCLQQHASSLSASCQQAVSAIKAPAAAKAKAPPAKTETAAAPPKAAAPAETAPPAAPAAPAKAAKAASKKAQLAAVARACGADYRIHCHGIRPGTGAAADCLKRNAATLSAACRHALSGVAAAKSKLAAAPAAAPRPPCGGARASRAAAAAGFAARGNVHPAHVVPRRLRQVLPWAAFRRRPGRVMPALQRRQPVAAVPGRARRAARRPLRHCHAKHVAMHSSLESRKEKSKETLCRNISCRALTLIRVSRAC